MLGTSLAEARSRRSNEVCATTSRLPTGGRTVTLSNPRHLPAMAAAISLELRNQYVLGYRPTQGVRDGDWRGRPWEEIVIYELHLGAFASKL